MKVNVKVKFTIKYAIKVKTFKLYSFFNLGARWGWVVDAKLRLLYSGERPITNCTGGWVSPTAGVDR